jgi:DNA primase
MSRGPVDRVARAERDAAFRRAVDEAKQRYNISDVVGRTRKVTRAGKNEKRALCAFHSERTPSMQLNDAKGTYHCFGCGASGDLVSYVMKTENIGFMDALRWLGAASLPGVDPSQRAKAAAEDEGDRQHAIDRARGVWEKARLAPGTPAEVYLRSRGIIMPIPHTIRFAMTPAWYNDDTGECGPDLPALVGAVVDGDDQLIGLQRIFLADGGKAKARMEKPKRSLGRVKGGALRLNSDAESHADELIVTEGPEDGLSLAQELDAEVWVTLGTAMMPFIDYPPRIVSIVIAGQNDGPGRAAAEKAEEELAERGFATRLMWPADGFKDWNDQLRGIWS